MKRFKKTCKFLAWSLLTIGVLASLFVVVFLGLESVYPFHVEREVFTDGRKTIVVEGMVHVGSASFYDDIREDIRKEKKAGAVYLYEGIREEKPDVPPTMAQAHRENQAAAEITSILLGNKFQRDLDIDRLYRLLARSAELEIQPQASFMDLGGGPDVNADMSAGELLARLRASQARNRSNHETGPKLTGQGAAPQSAELSTVPGIDAGHDIDIDALEKSLDTLNTQEQATMAFMVKAFLSSMLRISDLVGLVPYGDDIDTARTHVLASFIQQRPEKRIVITYGMRHVSGLLNELQRLNGQWKLVETASRQPFRQ